MLMAAMENGETKGPFARLSEVHNSLNGGKWLAANVEEVIESSNRIRELLDKEAESLAEKSGSLCDRRPQLIAHVEDILRKHKLLARQYEQLLRASCGNNYSAFNGANGPAGFLDLSCFQSPDHKSGICQLNAEASMFDSSLRSDCCNSDASVKGGSECSSLLSSDSDSETYKQSTYKSARSHLDARKMWQHKFGDTEEIGERDHMLLGSMAKYEEELSLSTQKLQLSEGEIAKLEKELEVVAGNFNFQLDSAKSEIQKREAALEMEKEKVMELQIQVSTLESQVLDSNDKIGSLEAELEVTKVKLEISEEVITNLQSGSSFEISDFSGELETQLELAQQEVVLLDAKLDEEKRKASEMHEKIQHCVAAIAERDDEIRKLRASLQEATEKFSLDEEQLRSHNSSLSEHLMLVEARAEEWEARCASLEKEILQCEADKTEMENLHEGQEISWRINIDCLKAELKEKVRLVEISSKELDALKPEYDMLEAEKDFANSKIQRLSAELGSREYQIQHMEGALHQLHIANVELISASESADKRYADLRLKVLDLEKEVESQKNEISDRSEEKREAIRQLCFTMEHYRTNYEELLQVFAALKGHFIGV